MQIIKRTDLRLLLADEGKHIRSIDDEMRTVKFIEKASDNDILSVITLTNACITE